MKNTFYTYIFISFCLQLTAQSIFEEIPKNPDATQTYVFYLHGGIVQDQGANAISPYYGEYDYLGILNTLKQKGFHVISEVRPKDTQEKAYAKKLKSQIEVLLNYGIPEDQIIILGASLGAYIAMETSIILKNSEIRYVILGLCSDYALNYFSEFKDSLYGNFLSIYERSDSKGKCESLFQEKSTHYNFKEIELNMGIDHAFLYKPYREWVEPFMKWSKD